MLIPSYPITLPESSLQAPVLTLFLLFPGLVSAFKSLYPILILTTSLLSITHTFTCILTPSERFFHGLLNRLQFSIFRLRGLVGLGNSVLFLELGMLLILRAFSRITVARTLFGLVTALAGTGLLRARL